MARATPKRKSADSSTPSGTLLNFFQKSGSKSNVKQEQTEDSDITPTRRGSIKARPSAPDHGSKGDPVVISDDDEPVLISSRPRPKSASPIPSAQAPCEAGPSRPRQTPSPIAAKTLPTPVQEDRNPFQGMPQFQPPPTWPGIVNTAERDLDVDHILNIDEDGDGSVRAESDDEAIQEEETGDNGPTSDIPVEEDMDDVMMIEPHPPPVRTPSTMTRLPAPEVSEAEEMDLDMAMQWDEPEDEGMGMEEEGDEEASDIIATPPPVVIKRKRGDKGGKTEECPVCGKSLKGKMPTVSL